MSGKSAFVFFAKNKRYNELETKLLNSGGKYLSLYNGIVPSAFNQPVVSHQILDSVDISQLSDGLQYLNYLAKYDNCMNLFEYRKASQTGEVLVKRFRRFYTVDLYSSLINDVDVWKCIGGVAPEVVSKNDGSGIGLQQDALGLKNIGVTVADSSYQFVFDTGASISVVSESFGKKSVSISFRRIKSKHGHLQAISLIAL